MSVDAVALFRPKDPQKLLPYLDLDEDNEQSTGLYAERLEDGAILVHTFQNYAEFVQDPLLGRMWLAQFGADLPFIHDDPRGILFFPDVIEPDPTTYHSVVAQVASDCTWIPQRAATQAEIDAHQADFLAQVESIQKDPNAFAAAMSEMQQQGAMPGVQGMDLQELARHLDMSKVEAMASKLVGGADMSSFDFGALVASVQKQVAEALGGLPTQAEEPPAAVSPSIKRKD
jgi:hypothetical protein